MCFKEKLKASKKVTQKPEKLVGMQVLNLSTLNNISTALILQGMCLKCVHGIIVSYPNSPGLVSCFHTPSLPLALIDSRYSIFEKFE